MGNGVAKPGRRWLTIAAVTFAMILPSVLTWFYFVALAGKGEVNAAQQLTYLIGKAVQFAFPLAFAITVAPDQLRMRPPSFKGIEYGAGFGIAVVVAMLAAYFGPLRHSATFATAALQVRGKLHEFGVESAAGFLALAAFVVIAHSLLEEYYWRWFVFGRLRELMPVWAAIVVASVGFMGHHVIVLNHYFPGRFFTATLPYSVGVGVGGAMWCWLYNKSDSVWSPWLSHLLIDGAIFFIGWDLLQRR